MKAGAAVAIIGLGVGALSLILVTRKAEAAPPPAPKILIPAASDIMAAGSIVELETYYNLIGELYITKEIDREGYLELYQAYETRFYELTGVTE